VGLLFATLDGWLHGFDASGSPLWRHSLGAPLIDVSTGEQPLSSDGVPSHAARPSSPRLLPALDGTLYFSAGNAVKHLPVTVREVVDVSPVIVSAMPDVYLTGERRSAVHVMQLQPEGVNISSDTPEGIDVSSSIVDDPNGDAMQWQTPPQEEGGGSVWPRVSTSQHRGESGGHQETRKLRIGSTQLSIVAVDKHSQDRRWAITFHELRSLARAPVPVEVVNLWRGRIDIHGRSVRLRLPEGMDSPAVATAASPTPAPQNPDGVCCGAEPVEETSNGASQERIFSFQSEVLAAFVFAESSWMNDAGSLALEVLARAAPAALPHLHRMVGGAMPHWLPAPVDSVDSQQQQQQQHPWRSISSRLKEHPIHHAKQSLALLTSSPLDSDVAKLKFELTAWRNSSQDPVNMQQPICFREEQPKFPSGYAYGLHFCFCASLLALATLINRALRRRRRSYVDSQAVIIEDVDELPTPSPQAVAAAGGTSDTQPTLPVSNMSSTALVPAESALGQSLRNGLFNATFTDAALLGRGGFGVVYKAKHRLEGGWYAVKLVPLDDLEDGEAVTVKQHYWEALNLRRLTDVRHVVRYFTCWFEEPQFLSEELATAGGLWRQQTRAAEVDAGQAAYLVKSPAITAPLMPAAAVSSMSGCSSGSLSARFLAPTQQVGTTVGGSETPNGLSAYPSESFEGDSYGSSAAVFFEEASAAAASATVVSSGPPQHQPRQQAIQARHGEDSVVHSPQLTGSNQREEVQKFAATKESPRRYRTVLMIQMELCQGPTLRKWLDAPDRRTAHPARSDRFVRGRKGEALELSFAKQLMKGIREIHAADMVHRDVKPQNLFVTHDDILKIGDFGLSRCAADRQEGGEKGVVGTPGYCAPEGGADAAAPADIFSAALVILELLCPPLETDMERVRVLEDLRERQSLPAHVEQEFPEHATLLKCMARQTPQDRPSAEEAHAILKRLGIGGPLSPILEAAGDPAVSCLAGGVI